MADNEMIDETQLSGLEKQVDALVKNIDEILSVQKTNIESPSDDNDMTGSGADNTGKWKGKSNKKHTQTVGSAVRNMVPGDDENNYSKSLEKAAELLGIAPAELEVSMMALEKAKARPFGNGGDDGDDDEPDDDEDDTKKAAPKDVKKAADEDETKKAAPADDEVVVLDGETILKADVGEGAFNLLKKQQERIAKQETDIKKAQEEAEMERLRKRADSEFGHVPGSTEERAQMLKVISALPKPLQASFQKVLLNSEKITKDAFASLGVVGGKTPEEMQKTRRDFETKVAEIKKRDNCNATEAMAKARHEDPEGFKAYQGNGN